MVEIVKLDTSSAENLSVSEVLGSEITDRESGEDDLGTGVNDLLELGEDNLPFGINNFLEVLGGLHAHLGVVLLGLELELDVQKENLWVVEVLGLLFEKDNAEVRMETLLEGQLTLGL